MMIMKTIRIRTIKIYKIIIPGNINIHEVQKTALLGMLHIQVGTANKLTSTIKHHMFNRVLSTNCAGIANGHSLGRLSYTTRAPR